MNGPILWSIAITGEGASSECGECGRVFNLLDTDDAAEFYGGHDCEG
jgi:hypothetical protein